MVIALGTSGTATGELYLDDGESLNSVSSLLYSHIKYTAQYTSLGNSGYPRKFALLLNILGSLKSTLLKSNYSNVPPLTQVRLLGLQGLQSPQVWINGSIYHSFTYDKINKVMMFTFQNKLFKVLLIEHLSLNMITPFEIQWVFNS